MSLVKLTALLDRLFGLRNERFCVAANFPLMLVPLIYNFAGMFANG